MKKRVLWACFLLAILLVCFSAVACATESNENTLVLSDNGISLNGTTLNEGEDGAVTLSRDIIYYEDKDTYESGNVYGEGTEADKVSAEEAKENLVITIRKAGTYRVSGALSKGQIAVDLGENAKTDETAVVNLILDHVDITCTVAPVINIYNVYECDTAYVQDSDNYKASATQDTTKAGINLIVADDSINNVHGAYVAKIFKDTPDQKKLHKYDGAVQSKQSMNIDGEEKGNGVLNIIADNEGLGSNMHLTVNGGKINIQSQDDGINVNEDGISVLTVNGGAVHIVAGLGAEGDGVDSNGYLVINGGVVIAIAKPMADSGLDSDMGSFVNGGYVVATGSPMDWTESDSKQVTMNIQFASQQDATEAIIVTDTEGKVLFAYDPEKDETTDKNQRGYQGAVISCPEFEVGKTYYLYVGGEVSGTDTDGLYDKDTVTGFSGATQQQYTGTDLRGHGGMRPGGGRGPRPEGFVPPEGFEHGQRPEGVMPPEGFEPPEDFQPGQRPKMSEGMTPPEGFMPGGFNGESAPQGPGMIEFLMGDKVNRFSGVSDATEEALKPTAMLPFKDVKKEDWHYNEIEMAYKNGLLKGVSSDTFEPDSGLTRAMLWTVIARLNGVEKSLPENAGAFWYSTVQTYVQENNISDGTEPESEITREQLITMLWRVAGCPGSENAPGNFKDSENLSAYAKEAMRWATEKGILQGTDESLKGTHKATRAEAAAILNRYVKQ
ncbi:MAG: S-layer homology domain-containing protein [Clostridia bacterium]|nr:S-layer homology domain-containing protein [Clostridia bacterium]